MMFPIADEGLVKEARDELRREVLLKALKAMQ